MKLCSGLHKSQTAFSFSCSFFFVQLFFMCWCKLPRWRNCSPHLSHVTTYYRAHDMILQILRIRIYEFFSVEKEKNFLIVKKTHTFFLSSEHLRNNILLPKLFWPTVRKTFKIRGWRLQGWEFAKILRSLEQFIQTVKGQNNFW